MDYFLEFFKHLYILVIETWMTTSRITFSLRLPDVYTQFRKRVEGGCRVRKCVDMPNTLNPLPEGIDEGEIPTMEQLGVKG